MCARVTGKGAKMMDADGRGREFNQNLFVHHRALVADSKEQFQKLMEEFGSVYQIGELKVV